MNLFKSARSLSETQLVLNPWEPAGTVCGLRGRRESGGEPEFNIFWVVSKEDWVDCFEEGSYARHIEALRVTEAVDIIHKGPMTLDKQFWGIFVVGVAGTLLECTPGVLWVKINQS